MARSIVYAPEAAEDLLQLYRYIAEQSARNGPAVTSGGSRPIAKAWRSFPNVENGGTTSGLVCASPVLSGGSALLSTLPPRLSSSIACCTAAVIWKDRSAEKKVSAIPQRDGSTLEPFR